MKQTFEIPNGCTRVTIEQHEDKLVTIFETPIKESLPPNMTTYEQEMKEREIKEQIKPERWRAEYGKRYWFVTDTFSVIDQDDIYCGINDIRYNAGNYFQTKQQARDFAERIKQLLR